MAEDWLDRIKWGDDGLVPAIAQELSTNTILTLAWMNRESLARTVASGEAHYWSRSRGKLWHKGEYYLRVEDMVLIKNGKAESLTSYDRERFRL
jgi:phosphoribosyl-AMP cyclohydrolase